MCEVLNFVFAFVFGVIVGGVGTYYKLLKDIQAFEREYKPILLLLNKRMQNEI